MNENDNINPILVTGATGYLAGWIVKNLLESGMTVHAAVRDVSNTEKRKHLDKIADNCKGEIISSEQFWPTSSDGEILKKSSGREKLKVIWKTNGQINISGVLVYWPSGESSFTLLEGSLNNGKISGKNTFHDKINIEITEQVSKVTN